MQVNIDINRLNHTDLNMYQCGMENCKPGHAFGPAVRDHYLIHYVHSGKGIFQVGSKVYHLKEGQGFLICPGVVTYYQADSEDPWTYSWVGFHGLKAELYLKHANLSQENPIFTYDRDDFIENCFQQIMATKKMARGRELRLLALLYLFLSQLIEVNGTRRFVDSGLEKQELYVKKVLEFIEMNYSRRITVSYIARHIGLDRSYLGTIFKKRLNCSLKDYIINYRVSKACELMKNTGLSIGDIARSVGYDDPLLFSKIFKKIKNASPREFRKAQRNL